MACNIQFPVVTRVVPQLLSTQLVSVQPLAMPIGSPFFINPISGGMEYLMNKKNHLIKQMNEFYQELNSVIYSKDDLDLLYIEQEYNELMYNWEKIVEAMKATKMI